MMHAVATSAISEIAMMSDACLRSMLRRYRRAVPATIGRVDPRVLRRRLLIAVAIVSAMGLGIELLDAYTSSPVIDALLPKLSLSYEQNLPTWFSASLLLLCSLAAGAIAGARPAMRRNRGGMGVAAG